MHNTRHALHIPGAPITGETEVGIASVTVSFGIFTLVQNKANVLITIITITSVTGLAVITTFAV